MSAFAVVVVVFGALLFIAIVRTLCLLACSCCNRRPDEVRPMSPSVVEAQLPPATFNYPGSRFSPKGVEHMLSIIEDVLVPIHYRDLVPPPSSSSTAPAPAPAPAANASSSSSSSKVPQAAVAAAAAAADTSVEATSSVASEASEVKCSCASKDAVTAETSADTAQQPSSAASPTVSPVVSSAASPLEQRGPLVPCNEQEEPSCVICMDVLEGDDLVYKLPCRHIHHTECLMAWFAKSRCALCPLCKTDVLRASGIDLSKMYSPDLRAVVVRN